MGKLIWSTSISMKYLKGSFMGCPDILCVALAAVVVVQITQLKPKVVGKFSWPTSISMKYQKETFSECIGLV